MKARFVGMLMVMAVTLLGGGTARGQDAIPVQTLLEWKPADQEVQQAVASEFIGLLEEAADHVAAHPQATYPVLLFDAESFSGAKARLHAKLLEVPWYASGARLHQTSLWWELGAQDEYPYLQLAGLVGLSQEKDADLTGYAVGVTLDCQDPTSSAAIFMFHQLPVASDDEQIAQGLIRAMRRTDVHVESAVIGLGFLRETNWLAIEKELQGPAGSNLPATTKSLLLFLLDDFFRMHRKPRPAWLMDAARNLPPIEGFPQAAFVFLSGADAKDAALAARGRSTDCAA